MHPRVAVHLRHQRKTTASEHVPLQDHAATKRGTAWAETCVQHSRVVPELHHVEFPRPCTRDHPLVQLLPSDDLLNEVDESASANKEHIERQDHKNSTPSGPTRIPRTVEQHFGGCFSFHRSYRRAFKKRNKIFPTQSCRISTAAHKALPMRITSGSTRRRN